MSNITILVSSLTVLQKLERGTEVIAKGTGNVNVPNNGPYITAFSAAQTALAAAEEAVAQHRRTGEQLTTARNNALETWLRELTSLASFTESATAGDAEKILSAGFGVKGLPTPPQPLTQVLNVRITFNGEPGKSVLSWKRLPNADAYVIECCQDPITPDGWTYLDTTPRTKFTGNGAVPGKVCWYRVRGVNGDGPGPWSEPAMRPVM